MRTIIVLLLIPVLGLILMFVVDPSTLLEPLLPEPTPSPTPAPSQGESATAISTETVTPVPTQTPDAARLYGTCEIAASPTGIAEVFGEEPEERVSNSQAENPGLTVIREGDEQEQDALEQLSIKVPDYWQTGYTGPARYALRLVPTTTEIEVCDYPQGYQLHRMQIDVRAVLMDQQTNSELASEEFTGNPANYCQSVLSVVEGSPKDKYSFNDLGESTFIFWLIDAVAQNTSLPGMAQFTVLGSPESTRGYKVIRFSPDGTRIITADYFSSVDVWDIYTGKLKLSINRARSVADARFSPDGRLIALAGLNLNLWDATTCEFIRVLEHPVEVSRVAFSPDGTTLLTHDDDGIKRLWDVATGDLLAEMEDKLVSFAPDGNLLIGTNHTVRHWNYVTDEELFKIERDPEDFHIINAMNLRPDGRGLLIGVGEVLELWDTQTNEVAQEFKCNTRNIQQIELSANGDFAASSDSFRNTCILNLRTGKVSSDRVWLRLEAELDPKFSPDSRYLLTIKSRQSIHIRELETLELVTELAGHNDLVFYAEFDPTGLHVLANDTPPRVWHLASILTE